MKAKTLVCVLILTGCAAQTGVIEVGAGKYFVARQAATGFSGLGNLKAEVLRDAAGHCALVNKPEVYVIGFQESQPPYILGNYPRVELVFACRGGVSAKTQPDQGV